MSGAVHPLHGNQARAVDPRDSVWLSASAGTGKTQVLSSRVLRLLLQPGVEPSQILCLTFTKAGATEMAARINETLAGWVRLPDTELFRRLEAIGAPATPAARDRARTLFAKVLDCPGGGLRIDTIHAFSQWLLGAFPHEAGLVPGTRAMEDRDRLLLARQVLADLLVAAGEQGRGELLAALSALSLRYDAGAVENWLLRCGEAREAWFGPGSWQGPLAPRLKALFGLPADASEADLAAFCADDAFDVRSLRRCMEINAAWKAKTGQDQAGVIAMWLESAPAVRLAGLEGLAEVFLTKKGEPRSTTSLDKIDPAYADHAARVIAAVRQVLDQKALLRLVAFLAPALELGRAFALAWDEAKAREGLIDFDDQIRRAAELLGRSDLADWIRYKLDRRFDHILVDEAQDTNAAQWRIIKAITGDFFTGEGARGDRLRTIFVVGDFKQAIFRFQGTSPENFRLAQEHFARLIDEAARNAAELLGGPDLRPLQDLGLERSFRTAQTVLDVVDAAIAGIGHAGFGLDRAPERHVGEARPGHVVLWQPVGGKPEDGAEAGDEGEESWLSRPERDMADRIARQVKQWLDDGLVLHKGGERPARAGDIMVLVRKRRELAGLIVARLHAAGVPVAGVDRLRLGAPLAVRDLVAALRFAAQPFDDLSLASLLVSPLLGWTQEDLLEHAWRDKGVPLWQHLRQSSHPLVTQAMAQVTALLALADYEAPQALLHWLLVGPWQGRRKLVARLGREANDPIDELLNAARAYASGATPSLVGFLAWFDAGEGELKREAGKSDDLVRVMTVHGSKGLQAPIVILADATGDPRAGRTSPLDLAEPQRQPEVDPIAIPLPSLRKEERLGRLQAAAEQAAREEEEEHWRLLYVAMTRAEEALYIGGALGKREDVPAEGSWYARLAPLFDAAEAEEDAIWTGCRLLGDRPTAMVRAEADRAANEAAAPVPAWLNRAPPAEPRPPRPLAPSSLGEDAGSDPPFPPGAMIEAARRGTLVHRLLERLPAVAEAERDGAARRWLARNAAELSEDARAEIAGAALAVVGDPRWADLFAADALAEVPVAALVGGRVVAGTIDRLVIRPDALRLVDFKTARRPPARLEEVPLATLRQMAAYAAALAAAYPGRRVEAALLYTQTPRLIELPEAVLAAHKPDFAGGE